MNKKLLAAALIVGSLTLTPQKAHALPPDAPVHGDWDAVYNVYASATYYAKEGYMYMMAGLGIW